jgi:hypothetical protein
VVNSTGNGMASPYNPYVEVIEALKHFDQGKGRNTMLLISDGLANVGVTVTRSDGLRPDANPGYTDDLGAYRIYGLPPGEYGFGFSQEGKFLVMDVGANDLFSVASQVDEKVAHPVPLKIVEDGDAYRLYAGRRWVRLKP